MRTRTGFTMIEMLVTISIIVALGALSLVGVLAAKKHANQIRVKDDLRLIELALEAYRGDCDGQYPSLADPATDYNSLNPYTIAGTGVPWLDYQNTRGAVLLCRALIGPGNAGNNYVSGSTPPNAANPGDDGADGPGFRKRRNSTSAIQSGKVYGPYIDASKFKIAYLTPPGQYQSFPMAYPVILDSDGTPILYFPAAPGNPVVTFGNFNPSTYTTNNAYVPTRYNFFDNAGVPGQTSSQSGYLSSNDFGVLAAQCGSPPFLLWTAGSDGVFGLVNGKTDDIANFDFPSNLQK